MTRGLGWFDKNSDWMTTTSYPLLRAVRFAFEHAGEMTFENEEGVDENPRLFVSPEHLALEHMATIKDLKQALMFIIDPSNWLGTRLMEFLVEQLHKYCFEEYASIFYAVWHTETPPDWGVGLMDYSAIDDARRDHDVPAFVKALVEKMAAWEKAHEEGHGMPVEDLV